MISWGSTEGVCIIKTPLIGKVREYVVLYLFIRLEKGFQLSSLPR